MSGRARGALVVLLLALAGGGLWLFRRPRATDADTVVVGRRGVAVQQVLAATDVQARGWDLAGQFHVTAGGRALLRSGDNLVDVLTGAPLLARPHAGLHDFCALGAGVVALEGATLLAYDGGAFEPALRLPWADMHLACGSDVIYAYGSGGLGGDVFALYAGGAERKLLHVPEPILALAAARERLYFSIWERIFTWTPGSQPALVLAIAEGAPVTSLALDGATGQLYFSAGEGVFELVDGAPQLLVAGATGDLEFFEDTLFVKDRRQQVILALSGFERTARAAEAGAAEPPVEPERDIEEPAPDGAADTPADSGGSSGAGSAGFEGGGSAPCLTLPGEPPRPCLQAPDLRPTLPRIPAPVPVPVAPAAPVAPAVPAAAPAAPAQPAPVPTPG